MYLKVYIITVFILLCNFEKDRALDDIVISVDTLM
jgi:hypothetical protein